MENRKYIIFNVSELDKINFYEVQETSVETIENLLMKQKHSLNGMEMNQSV